MKHPRLSPESLQTKLIRTVALLFEGKPLTTRMVMEHVCVSKATAKRYMAAIECSLPVEFIRVEKIIGRGPHKRRVIALRLPA